MIHFRDLRLAKAGTIAPTCIAGTKQLARYKTQVATTSVRDAVTCKKCLKKMYFGPPPGPQRI